MSIIDDYKNGLQGAPIDERARDEFLSEIPMPLYGDYSNETKDTGKGKIALPYKHVLKFDSEFGAYEAQTVGDCTSHGSRNAAMITVCSDIVQKKEPELFIARIATEPIYGYRGHAGHGMNPTRAARFVSTVSGLHVRKDYGIVNLTRYNAQIGTVWGRSGVPANVIQIGRESHIETVSLVRTPEEARDLLFNGYGLTIASSFGFANRRNQHGIAQRSGSWNHCFEADAIVYTPNGYKNINNFSIGDEVYDHLGNIQKVTNLFERDYNGEMIEVSAWGITKFISTSCHPFLVSREITKEDFIKEEDVSDGGISIITKNKLKTKYRKLMWVDAKDLQIGDWLATPKKFENKQKFLPIIFPTNNKTKNKPLPINSPSEDLAWMFGFYIGDGNTTNNHKVSFTFSSNETKYLEKLKKAFDLLGLKIYAKNFGKFYRVHCYSSVLAKFLNEQFGKCSTKRQIPKFLFEEGWNLDTVIDGIWSADGYINTGGYREIGMCSKKLIYQIKHILNSKDILCSINKINNNKSSFGGQARYLICIEQKNKCSFQKECEKFIYHPIRKLSKEIKNTKVYNLEVSNSHTFIVNGIASHNCMSIIGMDDTKQRHSECLFLIANSWGCYSEDTEILTESGWKFFKDLLPFDKVATNQNNILKFEYPTKYHEYDVDTELLNFKGRNIDLLVTDNHNMYCKEYNQYKKNDFKLIEAKELENTHTRYKFKKNCQGVENGYILYYKFAKHSFKMDDWLEFLGYFITEGHCGIYTTKRKKRKKIGVVNEVFKYKNIENQLIKQSQYSISISQIKEHTRNKIFNCLTRMGIAFSYNNGSFNFTDKDFVQELLKLGKCDKKYIPDYVWDCNIEQLKVFYNALMLGDGSKTKGKNSFYTSSKQLADDFQRLLLSIGYSGDIFIVNRVGQKTTSGNNRNLLEYVVKIKELSNETCPSDGWMPTRVPYKGKVYCVTVPGSVVYVRRNGNTAWCGNSHWISGPKFPEDQPEGSFWITATILHGMIRDGESWVFSGTKGFPSKDLNWSLYDQFL